PLILQTEVAECGLACLAMVASYYGYKVDLNTLRRRFSISLKGTKLSEIMKLGDQMELSSRPVRVSLKDIANLQTPAILHWDMSHFVVLKKVKGNRIVIHDPAIGERSYDFDEASKHFTGVALELTPTYKFERKKETKTLKLFELWTNIRGLNGTLLQLLVLSSILQLAALASPFYLQIIIDEVIVSYDKQLLSTLAFGFTLVLVINVLLSAFRSYVIMYISSNLSLQMGYNLFQHMMKLPLEYFQKRHIGDVVSRFSSQESIKEFLTQGVVSSVVDSFMAVTTLIMMFVLAPQLTIVVLAALAIYVFARIALYKPFKTKTEESVVASAKSDSNFMESVRGMQSIKLFGGERHRQNQWVQRYAEVINTDIRIRRIKITYEAFNSSIFGIENILVIFLGAQLVLGNELTIGMMMAFMTYKLQFSNRAADLVEQWINFKMLDIHLDRLSDIAMTDPDKDSQGNMQDVPRFQGQIELRNISYQYSPSEPFLYRNLNLTVTPGESVALIGGSGSGKTTLMKIMLGLIEPTEGEVLIDGKNIRDIGLDNYRKQVAAVMQDDQLLSGTISDNVCFFDTTPKPDTIRKCAELAAIDRDIEKMPMNYNSLVGDMGTTLSGGQKQRVMLARALYREPRCLFLDEATSHLDTRLEGIVNNNLRQFNMTTVMIAHRPDTIRWADRVVMLEEGQLQEVFVDKAQPVVQSNFAHQ
ncbi:MAG: peptidase domain-containing ABC transporter, partial [Pseudomonadales bacterium]|nr:peptidase domain-containing ABC transporter [Pseudomonadales bacterium]